MESDTPLTTDAHIDTMAMNLLRLIDLADALASAVECYDEACRISSPDSGLRGEWDTAMQALARAYRAALGSADSGAV